MNTNSASKVGEIFTKAGDAFNKLGDMVSLLHPSAQELSFTSAVKVQQPKQSVNEDYNNVLSDVNLLLNESTDDITTSNF